VRRVLIGLLLASPVQARVLDLHTEIRIAKSGELVVTERITLESRDKTPRLERELPSAARVVDVIHNGHPVSYAHEGARLRADPPLLNGRQLYQITYRAPLRIAMFGEHDALQWRLYGAERMTAEVFLPSSVPAREIKADASGAAYQSFVRDGRAAFRAQEAITLSVRFPRGVIQDPGVGQHALWFFSDHFGPVLLAFLLGSAVGVIVHLRKSTRLST
jgi:hypothetical protein